MGRIFTKNMDTGVRTNKQGAIYVDKKVFWSRPYIISVYRSLKNNVHVQ